MHCNWLNMHLAEKTLTPSNCWTGEDKDGAGAEEITAQIDTRSSGDARKRVGACHTKSDTLDSIVFLCMPIRHRGRVVKAMDC